MCESSHLLSRNSPFFRGRESDPPLAAEVTRVWPDRRRAAEGRRLSKHCVWVLTSSASGKTVNIEYRSWPQQTRSDLCKLAKKKTDGGMQMPKQKQRGGFFSSSSSFFPPSVHLVIRTLSVIGRDCEGRWLHQMLSPTNKSANMDTFDFTPCHVRGGGVLICSLHCINRHCPHTAVRNPCKTTHTFNTPQIHRNTRSKRLFQTIKLSFLRRK